MKHEQDQKPREEDIDKIRERLDPQAKKAYDLMFPNHYILTFTVFGYVIANLVFWAGGGYLLDYYLGTKPYLFIAGFILSFISTQITIYKKFSKLQ